MNTCSSCIYWDCFDDNSGECQKMTADIVENYYRKIRAIDKYSARVDINVTDDSGFDYRFVTSSTFGCTLYVRNTYEK